MFLAPNNRLAQGLTDQKTSIHDILISKLFAYVLKDIQLDEHISGLKTALKDTNQWYLIKLESAIK